jgi:hypothetical protein
VSAHDILNREFAEDPMRALKLCLYSLVALGCRHKDVYPAIGTKVASPVDIAAASDNQHFFVLNADFDRTYNTGSLLTLDKDGNKVGVIEVPRMGRSLTVAGNDLIATMDYQDDTGHAAPRVQLYDVSDPTKPVLTGDVELDCTPVNAAMVSGYKYFAVSCLDGSLWVGELKPNRYESRMFKVRQWGVMRRALYIDPKRELLFGFTTDPGREGLADEVLQDCETHDQQKATPKSYYPDSSRCDNHAFEPNDVPDAYEQNQRVLSNTGQREWFQYFVYDFKQESGDGDPLNHSAPQPPANQPHQFPFRYNNDPVVQNAELRWIYFNLANFDGSPDPSNAFDNSDFKFYRTNFFAAKADPDDPDVFYLSQRGSPNQSQFANNIVRVRLLSDPHPTIGVAADGQTQTYTAPPRNADVMSFERIYGFKGPEASRWVYTGDFQVQYLAGQKVVVVNNFRDLVTWVKEDRYFSIAGASLDNSGAWYSEVQGDTSPSNLQSFYNIAVLPTGRAASCSFYGNAVMLLDITPGVDIKVVNRIE